MQPHPNKKALTTKVIIDNNDSTIYIYYFSEKHNFSEKAADSIEKSAAAMLLSGIKLLVIVSIFSATDIYHHKMYIAK